MSRAMLHPIYRSSHRVHRDNHRASCGLHFLLTALLCSSCATPTVRQVESGAPVLPVVAAGGALSERGGERLVNERLGPQQGDEHVRELIAAFREQADTPLVADNHVSLLIDGPQTLAAIRKAVEAARHHVHVETYIFADDEIGRAFSELLLARHRDGIEVRVLYDAIGSVTTPAAFFDQMRDAGIEVREFRPLDPVRTLTWKINNRDHRKIVVIDGRIAFTGAYFAPNKELRRALIEAARRGVDVRLAVAAYRAAARSTT